MNIFCGQDNYIGSIIMTESELLSKLTLEDYDGEKVVMFEGQDQIGFEDAPGCMCIGFSDEDLIENAEFDEDIARDFQMHQQAIINWLKSIGYVEFN
jgi:hypothetical protein